MPIFRNIAIGGVVVGLLLLLILNSPWVGLVVIAASLALPVGAYLMLDPSQRRRLRRLNNRKQIGR